VTSSSSFGIGESWGDGLGRAPQGDVLHGDAGVGQGPRRGGERGHPVVDGDADPAGVGVDLGLGPGGPADGGGGGRELVGPVDDDVDPVAAQLGLELVGRPLGDHPAVVDHRDPVGQLVGLVQVLGGQQHRGPAGDEPPDALPDLVAAARVQPGGGLVKEQHRRGQDEAGGQVEPPPHPARVLLDRLAAGVAEPEPLQQLVGAAAGGAGAQVVEAAEQDQVLPAAEDLVDGRVLAEQPDAVADLRGLADHVEAGDPGPAAVGPQQGGQDPHRGGLAGAVGAEQPADRALGDGQVEAVEGVGRAVALAQPLGQNG